MNTNMMNVFIVTPTIHAFNIHIHRAVTAKSGIQEGSESARMKASNNGDSPPRNSRLITMRVVGSPEGAGGGSLTDDAGKDLGGRHDKSKPLRKTNLPR